MGRTATAKRNHRDTRLELFVVVALQLIGHPGVDHPGPHRIDQDLVLGSDLGQGPGHRFKCGLARHVVERELAARMANRAARDIDHPPAAGLLQMRPDGACQAERRRDVE
jgi:hypothetical protein